MRSSNPIGFSSGALRGMPGHRAVEKLAELRLAAIELSALREAELGAMIGLIEFGAGRFEYISIHLPSRLHMVSDAELIGNVAKWGGRWPLIVHPDIVARRDPWESLGERLLVENMDQRKANGRTYEELRWVRAELPRAGFCVDLAHARQVDPTMALAATLLTRFRDRLGQVHLSEVDSAGTHKRISASAAASFRSVAHLIPEGTPIILESVVDASEVLAEIEVVAEILADGRQTHAAHSATWATGYRYAY